MQFGFSTGLSGVFHGCNGFFEHLPDNDGDIFDGGVNGFEFGYINVEVLVVEFFDDVFRDESIEAADVECLAVSVDTGCHGDLELVVMAVSRRVIALTEYIAVFSVIELGNVEAVSGGELVMLSQDDGLHGLVPYFERYEGCESERDLRNGMIERFVDESEQSLHDRAHGQVGAGERPGDFTCELRQCVLPDGLVDLSDINEIPGGGIGAAAAGDIEFVVPAESPHGWPGGVSVIPPCGSGV